MAERVAITAKKPGAKRKCSNLCNQKPGFNSSGSTAEILLNLQRTAGNQAVQRLIKQGSLQKRNKIDQINDIDKQKADQVSGQVVSKPELILKSQLQEEKSIEDNKSEVTKEKPAINKHGIEIKAIEPVKKAATEAKPTIETSSRTTFLPGVSSETLLDNAMAPAVSKSATEPKGIPKEEKEVEIEYLKEGKVIESIVDSGEAVADKASDSPKGDLSFQSVVKIAKNIAIMEKAHAPAKVKSAQAQAAAVSPSNEVTSKAAARQVQEMDQAEPKPFDKAAFKAALIEKIESITPNNLKEADELKESGKVKSIKDNLTAQVVKSKEQSQGEIKEKVEQAPDKGGIEPKLVTPLPPTEAGPSPKSINFAQAAPKPRLESDVSLQEGNRALEQKMAGDNVTDELLEKSNEPDFIAAVNAKKASQAYAIEAPQVYRKEEQSTLSRSQSEMTLVARAQIEAMHVSRQKQFSQVAAKQVNIKDIDKNKREEIAKHILDIYNGTEERVKACLSKLDKDVDDLFDKGTMEAQTFFENYVDSRMKLYKLKRYSGPDGVLRWIRDAVFDLPDEINRFYEEGRKLYLKMMGDLLNRIAEIVEAGLRVAKNEISNGKERIKNYIDNLHVSLKSLGQEEAKKIQSSFDNLEQSVNDKQNQLIDSLSKNYVDKVRQLDARIKDMKAENRGLLNKAMDSVTGVIESIKRLKNMLSNALSRAKDAVLLIISNPIGFLGNLVKGVKQGFQNFVGKIDKYLLEGLMGWLFGALAEAGIQMPDSFDLKGILSVVLQILGLTYLNIRSRAVKIVGEKVVSVMEKTAGIFQTLITKGPVAIWEEMKEKLGDFKSMILVPIKDFVISKVITAGVTWILGLLNPVSAFIKAAKAIYDIIMFFVERASQVMTLINAIVDSVIAIAMGNITVAATKVEQALAKAIPVVIGLLAAILGLGGISEKVKSIIKKIQSPIEKGIDWVIEKAVKPFVMKTMTKVKAGSEALKKKGMALITWWKERRKFKTKAGEIHTLYFGGEGQYAKLVVASEPRAIRTYLKSLNIPSTDVRYSKLEQARALVEGLETITRGHSSKAPLDSQKADEMVAKLTELSLLLTELDEEGQTDIPKEANFNPAPFPKKSASMEFLSTKNIVRGGEPEGDSPEWDFLQSRGMTDNSYSNKWVRMHLISEKVGGPGKESNWIPAPNSINTGPQVLHSFEKSLKGLVEKEGKKHKPNVAWATVKVTELYDPQPEFDDLPHFVHFVSFNAGLHFQMKGNWKKDPKPLITELVKIPPPDQGEIPSLSDPSTTRLSRLKHKKFPDCSWIFTRGTVDKIKEDVRKNKEFTKANLEDRLRNIALKNDKWQGKVTFILLVIDTLVKDKKLRIK